ncbi:MAG: hypothetical protein ABFE07_21660 [Armatimonadia bacterium]
MLDMLHPRSDLRLITMEGMAGVCDYGDGAERYISADMTEFYGGTDYTNAKSIVLTQIRYSYAAPEKPWTLARLCGGGKSRKTSIIGKIAADWRSIASGQDMTNERSRLVIMSNQPLAADDAQALSSLRQHAASLSSGKCDPHYTPGLDDDALAALKALEDATGLHDPKETAGFLLALSLDGFGQPDLLQSVAEASLLVQEWYSGLSAAGVNHLMAAAQEAATAGFAQSITPDYVRGLLGISDSDLNPAPYICTPTPNWLLPSL